MMILGEADFTWKNKSSFPFSKDGERLPKAVLMRKGVNGRTVARLI